MERYIEPDVWSRRLASDQDVSGWIYDIEILLSAYGFDAQLFTGQVRSFYTTAEHGYFRRRCIESIAEENQINIHDPKQYEKIMRLLADVIRLSRRERIEWETGQKEPKLEQILSFFTITGQKIPAVFDQISAVKHAIAMTVNYIRAIPPIVDLDLIPDNHLILPTVRQCWADAKKHPHYRTPREKPRCNLNQHALIHIINKNPTMLWAKAESLGQLRVNIENLLNVSHPLFGPWIIFKYATLEEAPSNNKSIKNPHRNIWNRDHNSYKSIWS